LIQKFSQNSSENPKKGRRGCQEIILNRHKSEIDPESASVDAFCFLIGRKKSSLLIIKKVHKMGAQAEMTKMRQGTKTRYFIGVSFTKFEKKETVKPQKEKCFSASLQFQAKERIINQNKKFSLLLSNN